MINDRREELKSGSSPFRHKLRLHLASIGERLLPGTD